MVLLVTLAISVAVAHAQDYRGAQLLSLSNLTRRDVDHLSLKEISGDMEIMETKLDFVDILLLNDTETVKEEMNMNITYESLDDVQEKITKEQEMISLGSKINTTHSGSCLNWTKYYRLADIYNYLDYLQDTYPKWVTVETIGFSAEKRPIKLIKIVTKTNNEKVKAVWVDGGTHAREWITPAAATYIVHRILTSLHANESTFSNLTYYILPVMNPDGYEYSHTTDRLWRKNRSINNGSECIGTDLNRNWGFKWGGKESKTHPCSTNYRGTKAFSEPETASVSSYILNRTSELMAYLTLHSYGQSVLFPWAYTQSRPPDYMELYNLSYYMTYKVKVETGASYKYGTAAELYYIASGGSQDWAHGHAKIKYSYTMELRDTGVFAFSLPPYKILEASKDAFAAFTVLSKKIKT